MKTIRISLYLFVAITFFGSNSFAQKLNSAPNFSDVRQQIQSAIEKGEAPSIAVAVAVDGKIVWEEGFGWADKEKRIATTPHTRYPIASVSKPFVATGLMILAERGLVDLNRPVNQYLSSYGQLTGYAGDASTATLRHILQHRAGLPSHGQFVFQDEIYNPPSIWHFHNVQGQLCNTTHGCGWQRALNIGQTAGFSQAQIQEIIRGNF